MHREAPRLSVAASAVQAPATVEQLILARKRTLETLPLAVKRTSGGTLDIDTFAAQYSASPEKHVPRGQFAKFLSTVGQLVGDSTSDEVRSAAYVVYAIANAARSAAGAHDDRLDCKRASALLHVQVELTTWKELATSARSLQQWRSKYGVKPDITLDDAAAAPSAKSSSGGASSGSATSYNARLPFRSFYDYELFMDPDTPAAHVYAPLEMVARSLSVASARPQAAAAATAAASNSNSSSSASAAAVSQLARAAVSSATGTGQQPINAVWLYGRCFQYVLQAEAAASGAAWTPEALGVRILEELNTHRSSGVGNTAAESRLQTALFDLLGDFDFVGTLLQHRAQLLAISVSDYKRSANALSKVMSGGLASAEGAGGGGDGDFRGSGRPLMGAGVTVISEADRAAEKAARRARRKDERTRAALQEIGSKARIGADVTGGPAAGTADATLQMLIEAGLPPDMLGQELMLGLASDRSLTGDFAGGGTGTPTANGGRISADEVIASVGAGFGGTIRAALPEGTIETVKQGWKEITVPAQKPASSAAGGHKLVATSDMDRVSQVAFKGISRLNRLQSELFEAAYRSNDNLLVCAPTGAGKTNVAMLTVCHELLQHLDGVDPASINSDAAARSAVSVEGWKIVYVAPMKALAQEVVAKFSERLSGLGISVRELTGDMQLTKKEIDATQVIVTTPEKWDVITRKAGEGDLVAQVRLLIIDEVHLLAEDRGAVIESIVARTLRMVETSQSVIRIVGLSATLPNYRDVATFLRVNPSRGLFYFDNAYRPVPLQQTFIGVTENNAMKRLNLMNKIAWEKAIAAIRRGKQVMVFVHSRKDTVKTARALREHAMEEGALRILSPFSDEAAEDADAWGSSGGGGVIDYSKPGGGVSSSSSSASGAKSFYGDGSASSKIQGEGRISLTSAAWTAMQRDVEKSRNAELRELFRDGFGIHHAGMLRSDRNLSERMFAAGVTKILVCTATLAWGVNLPAHTVIIKGTQVYNAEAGDFDDLGMLDVMQIFGRAGRPQFDTSGEGIIVTSHDKLAHYTSMLTAQVPIESSFIKSLADHLNAEVVSGTVTNVREAVTWLSYTYLYVRMMKNPMAYGMLFDERERDPVLAEKRLALITAAAKTLDACRMVRFDAKSGNLAVTDLGRVASHYYIHHASVRTFNEVVDKGADDLTDAQVLNLICQADEFTALKVRDEELDELTSAKMDAHVSVKGDVTTTVAKVNVLLQAHIARRSLRSFTLISDMAYVTQSAGRIARALFEIFLRKGVCSLAGKLLAVSKSIEKQIWWDASPLWQVSGWLLPPDIVKKLADSGEPLDELCSMSAGELGSLARHPNMGPRIASVLRQLPYLDITPSVQPITRGILRVTLSIVPDFDWVDRVHGSVEPWWIWVEDAENQRIYHHEYLALTKKQYSAGEPIVLSFAIPMFEPLPSQYWVHAVSDRWLGLEAVREISFRHLVLPERHPPHTELLDLAPLPVAALGNPGYQSFYTSFTHFNPVQTQIFHSLYHSDVPVLLGAPTGSGKTVAAELAVFRLLSAHPGAKAIYIAPLKALVAERLRDWGDKFERRLGKRVVELTGDVTPDLAALKRSDIIITTPEKWDGISRSWQRREYVQAVGLVIIDEIHLLGEDRGPVLEVIVSRMRYIASRTDRHVRFVGLSTAMANARDLGDWLGIPPCGVFNFRPSVRPIPTEVHIQGFPGRHYCPRMASMNKPTYAGILAYSPTKPALIFVSSRRQTRLTALELIAFCASDENPKRFLRMPEEEVEDACARVKDTALKHTLAFGIGIHHAGLVEGDRTLVERLYGTGKIQVLVCTSTLAWGVNFPAHLVVVKGTEFYDAKTSRYVDFPITDVLQMIGRAGRPQFDDHAVALVLVHEPKKNFYRKFLFEAFPVESQLLDALPNHIAAEVAGGTITCRHDAVEYLTWTYFFRRLLQNPTYYGLEDSSTDGIRSYLYGVVDGIFANLATSGVIHLGEEAVETLEATSDGTKALPPAAEAVAPSVLGHIASFYYLDHATMGRFGSPDRLLPSMDEEAVCRLLCDAEEFAQLPVRHNEDGLNEELASNLPWSVPPSDYGSPHAKAFLLLQARMCRAPLPITDYITDSKGVLDNTMRVANALVDVAGSAGHASTATAAMRLVQCVVQGRMPTDSPLLQLPGMTPASANALAAACGLPAISGSSTTSDNPLMHPRHGLLRSLAAVSEGTLRSALTRSSGSGGGIGLSSDKANELLSVLRRLPIIDAKATLTSNSNSSASASSGSAVTAGSEATVSLSLRLTSGRSGASSSSSNSSKAYTPYYSKGKDWGWWVAIVAPCAPGDPEGPELLALKRIGSIDGSRSGGTPQELHITVPTVPAGSRLQLTACVISDAMAGLDVSAPLEVAVA